MVNGVNNNNINSYRNHPVRPSKTDMDAPPFLLQYEEKGVVWDHKNQDDKEKIKKEEERQKKASAAEAAAASVKTTSVNDVSAAAKGVPKTEGQSAGNLLQGIVDGIKGFFTGIFNFIWYGDDGKAKRADQTNKDAAVQPEKDSVTVPVKAVLPISASGGEQKDRDTLIKELIAKHDTKGVVDILTENHTIQPAHNSTLLTYYNRHGKIVELNRTNTGRILHGDRNTRNL